MEMTLQNVCAALGAVKEGGQWKARCPVPGHGQGHGDRNPSLVIAPGDKQPVVFKCWAGCSQEKIFGKLREMLGIADTSRPTATPVQTPQVGDGWGYSAERLSKAEVQLEQAREFLAARGISLETARAFHCGFDNGYLVIPTFSYGELVAVKLRSVKPCGPENKWRKFRKNAKTYYLFGTDVIRDKELGLADDLYVVESELDAMTAESAGFNAVSVDSANHSLNDDDLALLKAFPGALVLAPDNDAPGLTCAVRISTQLGFDHTQSIKFPNKDLGELYSEFPAAFADKLKALRSDSIPLWRQKLHTPNELAEGEPIQLVKNILPEGVTFFGSLSGVCKTWMALALAKALVTGDKFLNVWDVPEKRSVIYLCPEMGERSFRSRIEKLRLPMAGGFYCQTIKDGAIALNDPLLFQAVRDLGGPVIMLDTAIRFSGAESENDSVENANGLATLSFALLRAGALAVVCLHHSKKAQGEANFMTLENVLRGTGDFGAMADCVWGIQHARKRKGNNNWDDEYQLESKNLTRAYVECVKPRDLPAADPFIVQGRPYIDDTGNMAVIASDAQAGETMDTEKISDGAADKAERFVRENRAISKSGISKLVGISRNRIEEVLAGRGLKYVATSGRDGRWEDSAGESDAAF
jgi:hypothetical protein